MKVHELIATLLTLPQEANVYTEQYNSNAVAQIAVNRDENYVLIGDDLDSLIEDAPTFLKTPTRVEKAVIPKIYVVHLASVDEGIPYHHIECYNTLAAARECLKAWVAEEKRLRAKYEENQDAIQVTESEDYYSWTDNWANNASEIWIQEEIVWEKSSYIDIEDEETKGE